MYGKMCRLDERVNIMKTILYEELVTYYVTNYYDLAWKGYCIHDGLICSFKTRDETQEMVDACPCCSLDDPTDTSICTCENYKDLYVDVYPLSFFQLEVLF